MTINGLSHSSFDWATIKSNLITLLQDDNNFQDYKFTGSNFATIIEVISSVGDLFNFYINAMADESYISSAELYENINKLAELVAYNPGAYKAATLTANLTATITVPSDDDYFEIPKWSEFSVTSLSPENETIKFVNPYKVTYIGSAGINNYNEDIYLIQGVSETEAFTGTGAAFQNFEIDEAQAIEEYLSLTIDSGSGAETWTNVDNLYRNTDDTSKVFTTRYGKNEKIEIHFGDGAFGVKPPTASTIVVTYVKTLGKEGQISANEISGLDATIKLRDGGTGNEIGDPLSFTVAQTSVSDGGAVPLTSTEVANYTTRSSRTQDRAVTQQDHEDLFLVNFSEFILESLTINSNDYFEMTGETPIASASSYNNVYLYVLPRTGNTLSGNLRVEILDFLEDYKMATLNYVIKDLDYRNFVINILFKTQISTTRSVGEINADVDSAVRSFFNRTNRNIAEEIRYSNLMADIELVDGLSSCTLAMSSDLDAGYKYENIQLNNSQFPLLDSVTITASGTGD